MEDLRPGSREGRDDQLRAYMDGFEMWKRLFESGSLGIIRGDEPFGNAPRMFSELDVRNAAGLLTIDDIRKLKPFRHIFAKQEMPTFLNRRNRETLEMWRDRLAQQAKIPIVVAGWTYSNSHYVELWSPLVSRKIVENWRTVSDTSRKGKMLFRDIVDRISPDIDYAKFSANRIYTNVIDTDEVTEFLLGKIDTSYARNFFSNEFIDTLIRELAKSRKNEYRRIERTKLFRLLMKIYEKLLAYRKMWCEH